MNVAQALFAEGVAFAPDGEGSYPIGVSYDIITSPTRAQISILEIDLNGKKYSDFSSTFAVDVEHMIREKHRGYTDFDFLHLTYKD
jgi:hypothetical protein